ncbi:MAG: hypothetical protein M1821_007575 [Bathelium mastoideum]|nr:MAG: hypothetical protein M1821_007575 [Bathelium mastoideum]
MAMMAARPRLASAIFDDLSDVLRYPAKRRRVGTGCTTLHEAIGGGFKYGDGGVTCISGDVGTGKTLIAYHLLATHLLSSSNNFATIIDTTGSFDILRLSNLIRLRLHQNHSISRLKNAGATSAEIAPSIPPKEDYSDEATKLLERVNIAPVFDFIGLRDAVREFADRFTQSQYSITHQTTPLNPKRNPPRPPASPKRPLEIPDSDSEPEDLSSLSASPPPPSSPYPHHPKPNLNPNPDPSTSPPLLLIDTLTAPFQPILRAHPTTAHALLATFLRRLRRLTTDARCAMVLLNGASPSSSSSGSSFSTSFGSFSAFGSFGGGASGVVPPSVFAANGSVPMLEPGLGEGVDVHVLVSRVPSGERDGNGRGARGAVRVLEVVLDREEGREGQWGAFRVGRDGLALEGVRTTG